MSENINGILRMSNGQKDLIIKLEDLIEISENVEVNIDCGEHQDCSIIRMNGVKISDCSTIVYQDVSSAIVSLSLDEFSLDSSIDFVTIEMTVNTNETQYKFPIYITNNTLEQYKVYDKQV